MAHYTKEELELYRHHEMSVLGRISCATHLKECAQCARLFDELKKDDEFVKELRGSLAIFSELSKNEQAKPQK